MNENTRLVPLNKGQYAIVDAEDFELVSAYKWHLDKDGYAVTRAGDGKRLLMHRMIMQAPPRSLVDHANQNRIDNRRSNLRFCTRQQNAWNSKLRKGNKANYRGVHFDQKSGFWTASITVDRKPRFLGHYKKPEDAARAYDSASLFFCREFGQLNFSDSVARTVEQIRQDALALKPSRKTSNYRGVHWNSGRQRWVAKIVLRGKEKYLGSYKEELEAFEAYQKAIAQIQNA